MFTSHSSIHRHTDLRYLILSRARATMYVVAIGVSVLCAHFFSVDDTDLEVTLNLVVEMKPRMPPAWIYSIW
jgi:hypothetical protein